MMTRTVEHLVATHQAAQANRDRGERSWQYQLYVSMPETQTFEQKRDHFAEALRTSKWFRDATGDDAEELRTLWDEIKDAQDVEHFDDVLALIYDAADLGRCRISILR